MLSSLYYFKYNHIMGLLSDHKFTDGQYLCLPCASTDVIAKSVSHWLFDRHATNTHTHACIRPWVCSPTHTHTQTFSIHKLSYLSFSYSLYLYYFVYRIFIYLFSIQIYFSCFMYFFLSVSPLNWFFSYSALSFFSLSLFIKAKLFCMPGP